MKRYKRKSSKVGVFRTSGSLWGEILGRRVTFRANIYGPLDRRIRCTRTWLLKVFTQRNFVADFIRLKLTFIQTRSSATAEEPRDELRQLKYCRFLTEIVKQNLQSKRLSHWEVHRFLTLKLQATCAFRLQYV